MRIHIFYIHCTFILLKLATFVQFINSVTKYLFQKVLYLDEKRSHISIKSASKYYN